MLSFTTALVAVVVAAASIALVSAHPVQNIDHQQHPHQMFRRWGTFNGSPFMTTGFGTGFGFGFPFASNFVNSFDANSFASNFNDDTLFAHNVNANVASDNVNAFNSANVIA
ncbi:hypothetical protein LPJ57_004410 [Coemansia sp. RSA 486]|nr:hypothetical protein LPJ57_004410 [Coemansia sp. RSA 486]